MMKVRLKEKRIHNKSVFFATVIVIVIALISTKILGFTLDDIKNVGFLGGFFYMGVFAVFVGFPAYFILYYIEHTKKNP